MSADDAPWFRPSKFGGYRPGQAIIPTGTVLDGIAPPEPWVGQAICAQTDPEEFYPEKGGSTRAAKAICNRCPVQQECLEYAMEHNERYGIWGGMSERDRRAMRRAA